MAQLKQTVIDGQLRVSQGNSSELSIGLTGESNTGVFFSSGIVSIVVQGTERFRINNSGQLNARFGSSINPFRDLSRVFFLDINGTQELSNSINTSILRGNNVLELQGLRRITTASVYAISLVSNEIKINESLDTSTIVFPSSIEPAPLPNDFSVINFYFQPITTQYLRFSRFIPNNRPFPESDPWNEATHGQDYLQFIQNRNIIQNTAQCAFVQEYCSAYYKGRYLGLLNIWNSSQATEAQIKSMIESIPSVGPNGVDVTIVKGQYLTPSYKMTNISGDNYSSSSDCQGFSNGTVIKLEFKNSAVLNSVGDFKTIGTLLGTPFHFTNTTRYPVWRASNVKVNKGTFRFRHISDSDDIYLSFPELHWNSTLDEIQNWLNDYFNQLLSISGTQNVVVLGTGRGLDNQLGDLGKSSNLKELVYDSNGNIQRDGSGIPLLNDVPDNRKGSFFSLFGCVIRIRRQEILDLLSANSGHVAGGLELDIIEQFGLDETGPLLEVKPWDAGYTNFSTTVVPILERHSSSIYPAINPPMSNQTYFTQGIQFDGFHSRNLPTDTNSIYAPISDVWNDNANKYTKVFTDILTGLNIEYDFEERKFRRLTDHILYPTSGLFTPVVRRMDATDWAFMPVFFSDKGRLPTNTSTGRRGRITMRVHYTSGNNENNFYRSIYYRTDNKVNILDPSYVSGDVSLLNQPQFAQPVTSEQYWLSPDYMFPYNPCGNTRIISNDLSSFMFYDPELPNDANNLQERFSGYNYIDYMNSFYAKIKGINYIIFMCIRFSRHNSYFCGPNTRPGSPGHLEVRSLTMYARQLSFSGPLSSYQGHTFPSWIRSVDQLAIDMYNWNINTSSYRDATKSNPRKHHTNFRTTIEEFRAHNFQYTQSSQNIIPRNFYPLGMMCGWLSHNYELNTDNFPSTTTNNFFLYGNNHWPGNDHMPQVIEDEKMFVYNSFILYKFDFFNPNQVVNYAPNFPHGDNRIIFMYSFNKERRFFYSIRNTSSSSISILNGRIIIPPNHFAILQYDCIVEDTYLIKTIGINSTLQNARLTSIDRNRFLIYPNVFSNGSIFYPSNIYGKNLDGGGNEAINFSDPTEDNSLATKKYVDSQNTILQGTVNSLQTSIDQLQLKINDITDGGLIQSIKFITSDEFNDLLNNGDLVSRTLYLIKDSPSDYVTNIYYQD